MLDYKVDFFSHKYFLFLCYITIFQAISQIQFSSYIGYMLKSFCLLFLVMQCYMLEMLFHNSHWLHYHFYLYFCVTNKTDAYKALFFQSTIRIFYNSAYLSNFPYRQLSFSNNTICDRIFSYRCSMYMCVCVGVCPYVSEAKKYFEFEV